MVRAAQLIRQQCGPLGDPVVQPDVQGAQQIRRPGAVGAGASSPDSARNWPTRATGATRSSAGGSPAASGYASTAATASAEAAAPVWASTAGAVPDLRAGTERSCRSSPVTTRTTSPGSASGAHRASWASAASRSPAGNPSPASLLSHAAA